MDPCQDLRREVIRLLRQQKSDSLHEVEEGARLLQKAARQGSGANREEAHHRWLRYQREALFPAHAEAQAMDLLVVQIMGAPCSEVRKRAEDLGIDIKAFQEQAGQPAPPAAYSPPSRRRRPMSRDIDSVSRPVVPATAEAVETGPKSAPTAEQFVEPVVPAHVPPAPSRAASVASAPLPEELRQPIGMSRTLMPHLLDDEDYTLLSPEAEMSAVVHEPLEQLEARVESPEIAGDLAESPVEPPEEKGPSAFALQMDALRQSADEALDSIGAWSGRAYRATVQAFRGLPDWIKPRWAALLAGMRRWPVWALALLGSVLVAVVVGGIVFAVLRGRDGGGVVKAPTATATEVVAVVVPTDTPEPTSTPTATVEPTSMPEPLTPPPTAQPTSTTAPTATPEATPAPPTPQPTNTPLPPPTPAPPLVVVDGTYNVRSGPGTTYELLGQVQPGDILDVVARNEDTTWWQVCCLEGQNVWLFAELAPTQGVTSTVSVATNIAPSPTPAPLPTATPALPETLSGKIAFSAFNPGLRTYDVYVGTADGTSVQQVLTKASQPALSPDGSRMAYRNWDGAGRGIWVINTYGGGERIYTNFLEDALLSWSPDGQGLVIYSLRESDRVARMYQINLVDGSETEMKRDRAPISGEYPSWSASGRIAYRVIWPQAGLFVMNPNGTGETAVVLEETARTPAFSPDGQTLAFMSLRDGNWEIYRVNTDGSGLTRLTEDGADDGLPAWSPDGRALAFVSNRGGEWAMWAMTPNGQGVRRLFGLPGSPDGIIPDEPGYSTRGWLEERVSWAP